MSTSVPPLAVELMIACHVLADPTTHYSWNSSAGREWRAWLRKNDLVTETWQSTNRGKAWVEMIKSTPLPEQVWIDPRTDARAV